MRSADAHLTPQELESLLFAAADSNVTANRDATREAQQHLDGCDVCQGMAKRYANVDSALRSLCPKARLQNKPSAQPPAGHGPGAGHDCPPEETWLRLSAGLIDDAAASLYVAHAAQCDECGKLLRESMEDLAQDVTAEEHAAIGRLESSGPGWQRELSVKLAAESDADAGSVASAASTPARRQPAETTQKPRFVWWPRVAFAAASLVVVGVVGWRVWQRLNPNPNKLLAEAYTEHRTIELRMAGAAYGPMRVERGAGQAHTNMPAHLLEAEAILARGFEKHSEDPEWLQAQARAALLEWDYDAAIKKLDDALLMRPDDSGLLLDKATALFERAERLGPRAHIDYGEAAEDLSLALKKKPDDQVALFNRAIVYERLSLLNEAIADLQHYLLLDASGPWAQEASDELDRLKKVVKAHRQAQAEPLASPEMFIRLATEPEGVETLNKRIEEYQELAISEWLPVAFSADNPPSVRKQILDALRALASLLSERHQDRWMNDILRSRTSPEFYAALLSLRESLSRTSGDAMGAYVASTKAARLFELARSGAGSSRAELEQVHDLQRAQQGARCLERSRHLASRLTGSAYPWIRIQLQIERCGCSMKVGDFEAAMAHIARAMKDAHRFDYPVLQLRSAGLAAAVEVRQGNMPLGWAGNQQGLNEYWKQPYIPPLRAQQFYDASVYAAEDLGYLHLSKAFAAEDVRAASASSYPSIEALTHSHLGKLEMEAGELSSAAAELESAHRLLSLLPPTLATRAYLADSEIDLAELEILRGETKKACDRLRKLKPSLEGIESFPIPLRFYQAYAKALQGEGKQESAEAAFQEAEEIAASNLHQLREPSDRYYWVQETSALFRDFVQFELLRGNTDRALATWEWYRAASTLKPSVKAIAPDARLQAVLPLLRDQTVLSYALLPRGLALWLFDERGVHSKFIEISPTELAARTRHFLRSCEDPLSEVDSVERQAHALYGIFIAPFEDWLMPSRLLVIEADEELGDIPFQAFLDRANSYFMDSYRLIYSTGVFFRPAAESLTEVNANSRALVVTSSFILPGSNSDISSSFDVQREAEGVALNFMSSLVLSGVRASPKNLEALLPKVEVFHYGGHAAATTQQEGLVLFSPEQNRAVIWSGSSDLSHLFRKCKLVVLAACSTGTSRRGLRETHGRLVYTMIASGVPHIVASQWNVDTSTTTEFMKSFYAALLLKPDVANATSVAGRDIRTRLGKAHPYYWAAFFVFGRGKTPENTD